MSLIPRELWFDSDHFFESFYPLSPREQGPQFFSPKVDITEKSGHFEVLADLPGVKKEDINLTLESGVLTLNARRVEENESNEDKVIRKERRSGEITRSFTVGPNVHEQDIHATFKDGLLTLCFPKKEVDAAQKRTISIS